MAHVHCITRLSCTVAFGNANIIMKIRQATRDDIAALQLVVGATDLFPSDLLPAMMAPYFADPDSDDVWLACEDEGTAIGFCYAVAEQLAEGAWNMRALGVLPSKQGGGRGSAIVTALETLLRKRGQRVLIVDTSGTDAFARTRAFYRQNGYAEEARIRDFWARGDDKVVFWKSLS